jgi:DNA mismatch endonuclease (patch repair protein)
MVKRPPKPRGDIVSAEKRSDMMRAVGQQATNPEKTLALLMRGIGLRYRLKNRDLPGSPDLANRRCRWAIFVNGCFWHGHKNCAKTKSGRTSRVPVGNRAYWSQKLIENRIRDARKLRQLRSRGFVTMVVWECQLSDEETLKRRLAQLLPLRAARGSR